MGEGASQRSLARGRVQRIVCRISSLPTTQLSADPEWGWPTARRLCPHLALCNCHATLTQYRFSCTFNVHFFPLWRLHSCLGSSLCSPCPRYSSGKQPCSSTWQKLCCGPTNALTVHAPCSSNHMSSTSSSYPLHQYWCIY